MRRLISYTCLSVLWLAGMHASAQPSAYRIPGYSVTHYTDENGLPQNSIKGIVGDDNGYIWLATEAGLVRYDGRRFRLFTKQEMGTRHPRIYMIGRNPRTDYLYAIAEDYDQVRLAPDGRNPVFEPLDSSFHRSVLSQRYGIPVSPDLYVPFPMPDQKWTLMHASADTFFLASSGHVICRTAQKILWETDIEKKQDDYFFWPRGKLFLYNDQGGFNEITPQGVQPRFRIPGYKKLLWNIPENQAYILTQKNDLLLLETDPEKGLHTKPFMTGIPDDFNVETVFRYKKRLVFLGSYRQGLLLCKKQSFHTAGADQTAFGSLHYGILPWGNDIITAQKTRIDSNGVEHILVNDHYPFVNTTLTRWHGDTLLFAQSDYILVYSLTRGNVTKVIPFRNKITGLYRDPHGRVWAATTDSGVYMMQNGLKPVRRFPFQHHTNVMAEVRPGILLLGCIAGLYVYFENTGRLLEYPDTRTLNIRYIFMSREGNLYLCTYGDGIFRVTPGQGVKALPVDRMQYLKMAHCILEDNNGRLWISTNKGLFCVPERELTLNIQGRLPQVMYHHFDKEDGFVSNEFNGGGQPAGIKLASGEFAFPSINGIVRFHPDSVEFVRPFQQLDIERLDIDNITQHPLPDTVTVNRNFRLLEVFLTTPFYGSPRNLQLEYSTDTTRHDGWIPVHPDRRISLTSLPSGYSYITFRKRKIALLGAYNYTTLVLYKPKAFWEFRVFWAVCLIVGISGVVTVIRLRTRALKIRNNKLTEAVDKARVELLETIDSLTETTQKLEKKTRFQQWVTSSIIHDLRGPLRFINFYGGDIRREQEEISPAQTQFLKSVYFSALKIYTYTDNLVQLLRMEQVNDFPPQKIDFMELVEDKVDQFREQAKWNHVVLLPDPDSDPFIYVNGAALSIILQNLLDNAVKNVRHGHIYISLKNTEHLSVIEIRDEGPGMPPPLLEKINHDEISGQNGLGLRLVKSLVVQTGGTISFENLPRKGLSVRLEWEIPKEGRR